MDKQWRPERIWVVSDAMEFFVKNSTGILIGIVIGIGSVLLYQDISEPNNRNECIESAVKSARNEWGTKRLVSICNEKFPH